MNGLAIDDYGPISKNVGGISEMDRFSHKIRQSPDALDLTGYNTTSFGKVR